MARSSTWGLLLLTCVSSGCLVVTDSRTDGGGADPTAGADTDGADGDDGSSSDGSEGSSGGEDTGAGLDGETLYLQMCSACHGADARGTALGYELRHPQRDYATWVVRNGRVGAAFQSSMMAAYSTEILSEEALESIFDHLDSFERPTTGEELFADFCANCHGADGNGGAVGIEIAGRSLPDTVEKVRRGSGGTDYGNRILYMPVFDRDHLSDDELQAIVDAW